MGRPMMFSFLCSLSVLLDPACAGQEQAIARVPSLDSTTASQVATLVAVAETLHRLEVKGAGLAFGDPGGGGEGDEQLLYTAFRSSVALLERAVQMDPSNGRAWYWLGQALTARSYRGFGEWDSTDVAGSIRALERARRMLAPTDRIRTDLDETLDRQRKAAETLRQP